MKLGWIVPWDVNMHSLFKLGALARKTKGQGNFENLRAPNARKRYDRAGGGSGRGLAFYLNKKLFENEA